MGPLIGPAHSAIGFHWPLQRAVDALCAFDLSPPRTQACPIDNRKLILVHSIPSPRRGQVTGSNGAGRDIRHLADVACLRLVKLPTYTNNKLATTVSQFCKSHVSNPKSASQRPLRCHSGRCSFVALTQVDANQSALRRPQGRHPPVGASESRSVREKRRWKAGEKDQQGCTVALMSITPPFRSILTEHTHVVYQLSQTK